MKRLVKMALSMFILFTLLINAINAQQSQITAIYNLTTESNSGATIDTANGSGKWTWTANTKTLYLTNINAEFNGIAFSLPDGSIIVTEGITNINNTSGDYSIYCSGNLTISEKGANNTPFVIDGIQILGELTIEGHSYLEVGDIIGAGNDYIIATKVNVKESLLDTYGKIKTNNGVEITPVLTNSIWTKTESANSNTILQGKPLIKTMYNSVDLNVPSGAVLTIDKTGKINALGTTTLDKGAVLVNNGVVYVNDKNKIINNGTINNNGLFEGKIDENSTGNTTGIMADIDSVNLSGMETVDNTEREGWKWDKVTKTLTIKGARIKKLGILAGDFTLVVDGKNKIGTIARATVEEGSDNSDITGDINLNITGANDAIIEFDAINLGNNDSIYAKDVFLCVTDNNVAQMANTIKAGDIRLERAKVLAAQIVAEGTLTIDYSAIEIEVVTKPNDIAVIANKIILNNTQIKKPINASIGSINIGNLEKESFVIDDKGQNMIITVSEKETVIIEGINISGKVYDGQPIDYSGNPVAKRIDGTSVQAEFSTPFWYKYIDNQPRIMYTPPTNVGKYILEFKVDDTSMLYKGSRRFEFEIEKASLDDLAIIEGTAELGGVLTATVQALPIDFGNPTYVWTQNNKEIEGATDLTYTIKSENVGKSLQFIVKSALGNYMDIKSNIILVNGKDPGITKWPTISPIKYGQVIGAAIGDDAQTVATGSFTFENHNFKPDVSTSTYKLTFTADEVGYNTVTKDVTIIVNKGTLVAKNGSKQYTSKYGQKLQSIVLDMGMCNENDLNETVEGIWSWNTPDKSIVETGNYQATFAPKDATRYEITQQDIDINMERANLKCDYTLSNTSARPGDTVKITINLSNPYNNSLKDSIPQASEVTISCAGTSIGVVQGNNGRYTIDYAVANDAEFGDINFIVETEENDRYEALSKSLTLTITDKELTTVTLMAAKHSIIYGEELSLVATVKSGNSPLSQGTVTLSIKDNLEYISEPVNVSNGTAKFDLNHTTLNSIGEYIFEVVYTDTAGIYAGGKAYDTVNIAPKEIIITIKNKKINIGDAIPNDNEFEITVEGLVEGDKLSKEPHILAYTFDNKKAGKYVIEAGSAEASPNYFITYKKGSFEVVDPDAPIIPEVPSDGGGAVFIPPSEATIKEGIATIKKDAIIKGDIAIVEISTADIAKVVQGKDGDKVNEIIIEPKIKNKVTKTEVSLPLKSLRNIKDVKLIIKNPSIEILLNNEALIQIGNADSKILLIQTDNIDHITTISIKIDGQELAKEIKGLKAKIDTEITNKDVVAFQINEDKTETIITKAIIKDGKMMVNIGKGIKLAIKENGIEFEDIQENTWCKDAIDFIASRKILTGTLPTTFDINSKMTRAMLVTSLGRLESIDKAMQDSTDLAFKDVNANLYYAPYAIWASKNKIVIGKDNMFVPNENITREELATILYRYLVAIDEVNENVSRETIDSYQDKEKVSDWALESMTYLVENKVITGKVDKLDPKGLASRGEVATMIMRLIYLFN